MKLKQLMNNFHELNIGGSTIWFSYETPIAFLIDDIALVRENKWGKTTGRHINYVKQHHNHVELDQAQFEWELKNIT